MTADVLQFGDSTTLHLLHFRLHFTSDEMAPSICAPPNACGRGWLDIVSSCGSVIVLSIWSLQRPETNQNLGKFGSKFVWAVITAFAPEILLAVTIIQYNDVMQMHEEYGWEISKCYFVKMGSFRVQISREHEDKGKDVSDNSPLLVVKDESECTLTLDGQPLKPEDLRKLELAEQVKWNPPYFDALTDIDLWPTVIACLQALYFLLQCLLRRIAHLPLSALEYSTIAYVAIAVTVYVLQRDKPEPLNAPLPLPLCPKPIANNDGEASPSSRDAGNRTTPRAADLEQGDSASSPPPGRAHGPRNLTLKERIQRWWLSHWIQLLCLGSSLIYGFIHILSWSVQFPTQAEEWLWCISSVLVIFGMAAVAGLIRYSDRLQKRGYASAICLALLLSSRVFLFLEMFLSLRCEEAGIWVDSPSFTQYLSFI
ncbi:hypothetical protein CERSUDRAFT_94416 [Gelatoporia subvermispora B]|uniref:Uncharacterized protein n=1 Tax=Ceriporiopsis subvermispora (strain B) TaxID=914234 RepID=M2RF20_CERS8|nr:hypothetical protein CERSUDRAFT_94416 [Gelatoporia subvermispora B]